MRWVGLGAALWLLNFALSFHNLWPTFWVTTHHELSIEMACLLFGLFLVGELRARHGTPPALSRGALTVLAVVVLVMTVGRYAEVTAPALYGRRINLYWDGRYLPNVAAMMIQVVPVWLIALGTAAFAGLFAAVYLALRWSLGRISRALAVPTERRAVGALTAVLVGLYAAGAVRAPAVGLPLPTLRLFSLPVTGTYKQQLQFIASAVAAAHGHGQLPPPADLGNAPLARLGNADVLLIFMESYGATSYDMPEMAQALADERADLARATDETGRYAVSAFVESPTFGGGSWLAHSSLMTGTTIKDNGVYNLLLTQRRDSLPRRFERSGYRAVAVMPGLKQAWPEGSFYGFDRTYGAADLRYAGPEFGWWRIPDQYTLAKLDQLELGVSPRPPLFVFFPTISTHIPFRPTAPYQPDWARVLGPDPFPADAVEASLAEKPEWTHLAPGYVGALAYTFEYWAGYLRQRPDANFVLILIGDHQPASSVSGEGARWDVPIHVISKRRDIVEALEHAGFEPGFEPVGKAIGPMSTLAKLLLGDFEGKDGAKAGGVTDPGSTGALSRPAPP
jgi:hypothetical protein